MATSGSTTDARSVGRGAVVSFCAHVALATLAVVAAVDTAPDPAAVSFWLLAGFGALGAVAAALARVTTLWATSSRGSALISTAAALLVVSAVLAVVAAVREGSATLIAIAVLLLLINGILLRGAALVANAGAHPDVGAGKGTDA